MPPNMNYAFASDAAEKGSLKNLENGSIGFQFFVGSDKPRSAPLLSLTQLVDKERGAHCFKVYHQTRFMNQRD